MTNVNTIDINRINRRSLSMSKNISKINRALRNSRASVELEGLEVSQTNDEICRNLLSGEISNSEANRLILMSHGILI